MPTYLPWIQGDIPAPHETYDASIDRDQLSWAGPHGSGVGLTLYPNTPLGNSGEETHVIIDGEVGHLHRFDESDSSACGWDLSGRHCNFLELSLSPGDWTKDQAIDELMRIARFVAPRCVMRIDSNLNDRRDAVSNSPDGSCVSDSSWPW